MLEGAQAEDLGQLIDGCGLGPGGLRFAHAFARGLHIGTREPCLQSRELGGQIALVRLGPIQLRQRVHVISIR
jgi:hypothetical protein